MHVYIGFKFFNPLCKLVCIDISIPNKKKLNKWFKKKLIKKMFLKGMLLPF